MNLFYNTPIENLTQICDYIGYLSNLLKSEQEFVYALNPLLQRTDGDNKQFTVLLLKQEDERRLNLELDRYEQNPQDHLSEQEKRILQSEMKKFSDEVFSVSGLNTRLISLLDNTDKVERLLSLEGVTNLEILFQTGAYLLNQLISCYEVNNKLINQTLGNNSHRDLPKHITEYPKVLLRNKNQLVSLTTWDKARNLCRASFLRQVMWDLLYSQLLKLKEIAGEEEPSSYRDQLYRTCCWLEMVTVIDWGDDDDHSESDFEKLSIGLAEGGFTDLKHIEETEAGINGSLDDEAVIPEFSFIDQFFNALKEGKYPDFLNQNDTFEATEVRAQDQKLNYPQYRKYLSNYNTSIDEIFNFQTESKNESLNTAHVVQAVIEPILSPVPDKEAPLKSALSHQEAARVAFEQEMNRRERPEFKPPEFFGLEVVDYTQTTGDCLFDNVAPQIGEGSGDTIRKGIVNFMESDADHYSALPNMKNDRTLQKGSGEIVTYQNWQGYLALMAKKTVWGTDVKIAALSDMLEAPIAVYTIQGWTFHNEKAINAPIFLVNQGRNHFVSCIPKDGLTGETVFQNMKTAIWADPVD